MAVDHTTKVVSLQNQSKQKYMKNKQIYGTYMFVSLATAFAVIAMSFGALSFAQTTTPLTCSVSPTSVRTNQAAIFTASGGNGTYIWSGTNLDVSNASGNSFAVSYPNVGVYAITVQSAGLSATCNFSVVASTSSVLVCSPGTQNVTLGQTANFTATGGSGAYTWSAPDLDIANANGSGFSASYASTGLKTLTVTSNGVSDTCAVNVLAGTFTPPVTPSLPATGVSFSH